MYRTARLVPSAAALTHSKLLAFNKKTYFYIVSNKVHT